MSAEEPLPGGSNPLVVRVGNTIRRPVHDWTPSIRALLLHLENVGFDGAPRYLGSDAQGREVLSWVHGEVPQPPYPAWSMTETALIDFAGLLRRYHDATAAFDRTGFSVWADEWGDPSGGPVVCHNDLFPENAVFRDGRVVALIDFEMAAPGRPLWDVAIAAQEWAPLNAPQTREDHPRDLDGVARLGRFAHAYGIEKDAADEMVDLIITERAYSHAHIRAQIAAGDELWIERWADTGEQRAAADEAWLRERRDALVQAVLR